MSKQRSVVVTGAGSGFGRLTAEAFAGDGWRVYATLRDVEGRNARAAAELRSIGIASVELDVTQDASVEAAAKLILDETGAIDVLVNNAGTAFFGIQEAYTPALVEAQFATNVIGPLRVNRAFLPSMRARKSGLVVYVSSVVGRIIGPFGGIYTASKWALEALAETSSYELAPFGVDVAIVEPGAYATEIMSKFGSADDADRIQSYGALAKLAEERVEAIIASAAGRNPGEVAAAILRLANAPPGARPLRTVVPAIATIEAINAALAPIQRRAVDSLGIEGISSKTHA